MWQPWPARPIANSTGNELHRFSYPNSETADPFFAIALAPEATNLLAAHRAGGVIALWDLAGKTLLRTIRAHTNSVQTLALPPDGTSLAAGTAGHVHPALTLWDIPPLPQAAIGHRDGRVRLWDFNRQQLIQELKRHEDSWVAGATVEFSRDDRWLVSLAKGSGTVNLVDVSNPGSPRPVRTLRPSSGTTWFVAFAPDSKSLVTYSTDGLIKFWNLRTLTVALTLSHGHGPCNVLAFARDGTLLISQDGNSTLRLWAAPLLRR